MSDCIGTGCKREGLQDEVDRLTKSIDLKDAAIRQLEADNKAAWVTNRAIDAERMKFRDELEALRAQIAADAKDAARYRWLREQPLDLYKGLWIMDATHAKGLNGEHADAAIDAAMKGGSDAQRI